MAEGPTITIALTAPTSQVHTSSIPDDILLEIVPYLPFQDSVNLALVSKHVYAVVPPRVTSAVCRRDTGLLALHHYICDNRALTEGRALALRSLNIKRSIFYSRNEHGPLISMLLEVLQVTNNLRRLIFPSFPDSDVHGIGPHLDALFSFVTQMQSLSHLCLYSYSILSTRCVPLFPPTIQTLHILSLYISTEQLCGGTRNILRDLTLLEPRALKHLVIENRLLYEDDFPMPYGGSDILLPTVQELTFTKISTSFPPSDIANFFPNLQSLHYVESSLPDIGTVEDREHELYSPSPVYRLRTLTVVEDMYDNDSAPTPTVWHPNRLVRIVPRDPFPGKNVCDPSLLVSLTMRFSSQVDPNVWELLSTDHYPVLSSVELESTTLTVSAILTALFGPSAALRISACERLICLTILAWDEQDVDPPVEEEHARLAASQHPGLRYVAFAASHEVSYDWREEYAGNGAPWRWWKVDRISTRERRTPPPLGDEVGVHVREIPAWEGERVRAYLREADVEAVDRFDERFVALR